MKAINLLIVSNLSIGVSFLIISFATGWLYFHRHRDWPKSWVLLLVGSSVGTCGFARVVHAFTYYEWPDVSADSMTLSDSLSALFAVGCALLSPWAVYSIRLFPTPEQIKDNAIKAGRSLEIAASANRMAQEKEIAQKSERETQSRMVELKSLLDHANLETSLRERILFLVERKEA